MKELIIIGSGPGGYRTAAYAARMGIHTTIFEDKEAGGTCLNCGCIPTKTLCHEAEIVDILLPDLMPSEQPSFAVGGGLRSVI